MLHEKMEKVSSQQFTKKATFALPVMEGKKAYRSEVVLQALVDIDGNVFNADETSMDRLGRVLSIASWKFNQAVAAGATPAQAYVGVYKNIMVPWKLANNTMGSFDVETLCRAQEAAVNNLGAVWVQYG